MNKIISVFVVLVLVFFVNSCTSTKSTSSTSQNSDLSSGTDLVPDYTTIFELELVDEGDNGYSYTIAGYKGNSPRVIIPEQINGITVKKIGNIAFSTGKSPRGTNYNFYQTMAMGEELIDGSTGKATVDIILVKIPDTVTVIGNGAFAQCGYLKSIELPENLIEIKANAFLGCYSLQSINIPNMVNKIDAGAFAYCSALESVTLSENIGYIGPYAFSGCRNLSRVIIPESISEIYFEKNNAFNRCTSLTDSTIAELSRRGYVF